MAAREPERRSSAPQQRRRGRRGGAGENKGLWPTAGNRRGRFLSVPPSGLRVYPAFSSTTKGRPHTAVAASSRLLPRDVGWGMALGLPVHYGWLGGRRRSTAGQTRPDRGGGGGCARGRSACSIRVRLPPEPSAIEPIPPPDLGGGSPVVRCHSVRFGSNTEFNPGFGQRPVHPSWTGREGSGPVLYAATTATAPLGDHLPQGAGERRDKRVARSRRGDGVVSTRWIA